MEMLEVTHQIRTSERRSFRGCRRRWDWAYVQGYAPLEEPKPLEFGRAFHVGMEALYDPDTWGKTTLDERFENACAAFERECEIQRKNYLRTVGVARLDREEKDDYDERVRLGRGMFEYYTYNVHAIEDDWLKPVRVEVEFDVPVTDERGEPVYCNNSPRCGQIHDNPARVTHGGRIDALVEDVIRGGYWIIDWKTAASLRASADMLEFDDQICSYCWALRDKCRVDIRGFIYVEILKAYPIPPKRLSRIRNGCMYSQDKRMPCTAELYRETVKKEDSQAYADGLYNEFILYLAQDKDAAKFHQRFTIHKTPTELTNIGANIATEAEAMLDDRMKIFPSVGRFSCPSCAYRAPCQMKFKGEDYVYTLDTLFKKVK